MTTAARLGRNLLLRDGGTGGSPVIAAMRTTKFTIAGEKIDVTDKDSVGQYRELLAAAGIVSVSISATGLLHGNTQSTTLANRTIARSLDTYRLEFDNGDNLVGSFQLVNFEVAGDYNNEQTYAITLESGGSLTFTTV
jgi:TP901-1 family phage major tail protein